MERYLSVCLVEAYRVLEILQAWRKCRRCFFFISLEADIDKRELGILFLHILQTGNQSTVQNVKFDQGRYKPKGSLLSLDYSTNWLLQTDFALIRKIFQAYSFYSLFCYDAIVSHSLIHITLTSFSLIFDIRNKISFLFGFF